MATEIIVRTRGVRKWIERDPSYVTVTRIPTLRNDAGGTTQGVALTIGPIRGRMVRSTGSRFRPGEPETTVGPRERDLDRFVCLPNTDLTKVVMAGDRFSLNGILYECTKVLPYPHKRSAVMEKR